MTNIVFFTDNGLITGFSIEGHSGYAPEGEDVVCAAVSSAAYMAVNTLTDVLRITPLVLNTDEASMEMLLKSKDYSEAAVILEGFRLHISALQQQYGNYIKVKIRR